MHNEANLKMSLTIHLRPRAVFLISSYFSPFCLHLDKYYDRMRKRDTTHVRLRVLGPSWIKELESRSFWAAARVAFFEVVFAVSVTFGAFTGAFAFRLAGGSADMLSSSAPSQDMDSSLGILEEVDDLDHAK